MLIFLHLLHCIQSVLRATRSYLNFFFSESACSSLCVCVCVRERGGGRERERERGREKKKKKKKEHSQKKMSTPARHNTDLMDPLSKGQHTVVLGNGVACATSTHSAIALWVVLANAL